MHHTKRFTSCLTTLFLLFALTACDSKEESSTDAVQQEPSAQTEPAEAPVAEAPPEIEKPGLTLEQKEELKPIYIEEAQAEITPDNAEEQADALANELEEELENL